MGFLYGTRLQEVEKHVRERNIPAGPDASFDDDSDEDSLDSEDL